MLAVRKGLITTQHQHYSEYKIKPISSAKWQQKIENILSVSTNTPSTSESSLIFLTAMSSQEARSHKRPCDAEGNSSSTSDKSLQNKRSRLGLAFGQTNRFVAPSTVIFTFFFLPTKLIL